ncbi:MAG: FHA domain-containing protein, partial [Myxococcota bacterium]
MFSVLITEKGGEQKRVTFDKDEVTIGRVQGNDIILPKGNVSKRHARILVKDEGFAVVDLKSTNGTYVNGRRITSRQAVAGSDKIFIGDFILHVEPEAGASLEPPPERRTAPPPPPAPSPAPVDVRDDDDDDADRDASPPPRTVPPHGLAPRPKSAGVPLSASPARAASPAPAQSRLFDEDEPVERDLDEHEVDEEAVVEALSVAAPSRALPPSERPTPRPPAAAPRASDTPRPDGRLATPPPARPESGPPTLRPLSKESRRPQAPSTGEILREIGERLAEALGVRKLDSKRLADPALREKARDEFDEIVAELEIAGRFPLGVDRDVVAKDILDEALGLGAIGPLLDDPEVEAILVNRPDRIFVERGGTLALIERVFSSDGALRAVIDRLAGAAGAARGEDEPPIVEARLPG